MAFDDAGIRSMTRRAMGAEMLDAETELRLARAWRDHGDEPALHRLVNAYMRLAVSMAARYRRYGAPMPDLVQEAGVGLMKAAEKFDPDRGVRFSTYAVWWIKASIQDYVMRNWSLVRTGSTSSQKALFFNLRRVRARIEREAFAHGEVVDGPRLREMIAEEIGVPLRDVEMMDARLAGADFSLNAQQAGDEGREWVETLEDDAPQAAETVARNADIARARAWLAEAMGALNARERMIIVERKLRDEPRTLESLGQQLGLSKERIRQLEAQALLKLRRRLECATGAAAEALVVA
ncbi:RNA polymerase factor sigma-32 [Amaricoccus sp.]|uniref:RNA polymerase factor sigma-32 n=1 Tax=Amaricoccus sp. TaxID=1872485 RepID=UPI001B67CA0B|nr:RNA polymerase factor sigma-32 [Amaricoccus sp.]MBP7001195.1 RNA polymerase factor sigma-32 [Amaricoccus sp.]